MPEQNKGASARQQSLTLNLTVNDGVRAIDFYKKAFGAQELMRLGGPGDQGIMHAELQIGNSTFYLNDEYPEMSIRSPKTLGGSTVVIYLSVEDADSAYERAIEAGAQEVMAVEDMFWGDRMGTVIDPFGHHWGISSHKEDVPEEEVRRRAEEMYAQWAAAKQGDARSSM